MFCCLIGFQQSAFVFWLSVCLSVIMPPKDRCTMFCPFCGQGFGGQVSAYMRHMRSHYNRTPRLRVCHYCGYSPKVDKAAWGMDHRHECRVKPDDQPARDAVYVATPQKIREGLGCLFGFSEEAWRLNQEHDQVVARGKNARRREKRRRERAPAAMPKGKKTPSAALGAPPAPVPAPPAPVPAPAIPSSSGYQKRKGSRPRKRPVIETSSSDSD